MYFNDFSRIFCYISSMNEPRGWTFLCIWYENRGLGFTIFHYVPEEFLLCLEAQVWQAPCLCIDVGWYIEIRKLPLFINTAIVLGSLQSFLLGLLSCSSCDFLNYGRESHAPASSRCPVGISPTNEEIISSWLHTRVHSGFTVLFCYIRHPCFGCLETILMYC